MTCPNKCLLLLGLSVLLIDSGACGAAPVDEVVCRQRLAKWLRCYQTEVRLDDGISDWKFSYLDEQRKELYALINDMGGIYQTRAERRPIVSCAKDNIAFFSVPKAEAKTRIPGVLLVHPLHDSGFATFFAIDAEGKAAVGAIDFGADYSTGGAIYTPEKPGVVFSTSSRKKKDSFTQYRIAPKQGQKQLFGTRLPVEWPATEKVAGHPGIFSEPIVPKKKGRWIRLDNMDKSARRAKAKPSD